MPAIVIIPARYASVRFPGKPLQLIHNKPLIQHVYERVKRADKIEEVYVATDNDEIYRVVESFGGKAVMTLTSHKSGTDRIAEALLKIEETLSGSLKSEIIVNVQGDEPMIKPQMVNEVVEVLLEDSKADIGTLVKKIEDLAEVTNPNIVKAVFNKEGFALFFSRSPIPYYRDIPTMSDKSKECKRKVNIYKHIGIYSYRRKCLLDLVSLPPSPLEEAEKLEQLRALENGFRIKVKITEYETIGVDTPEDIERVRRCLSTYS